MTASANRTASNIGSCLRNLTLLIFTVGAMGSMFDLMLLGHFENIRQWPPLFLLPAGLVMLAWQRTQRGHCSTRSFQGVMALFIVSGVVGVWFHCNSNAKLELQMHPSMDGWRVVRESLLGPAPVLAPGTMVQLGLLGLTYTYRHPFLRRRFSPSDTGPMSVTRTDV